MMRNKFKETKKYLNLANLEKASNNDRMRSKEAVWNKLTHQINYDENSMPKKFRLNEIKLRYKVAFLSIFALSILSVFTITIFSKDLVKPKMTALSPAAERNFGITSREDYKSVVDNVNEDLLKKVVYLGKEDLPELKENLKNLYHYKAEIYENPESKNFLKMSFQQDVSKPITVETWYNYLYFKSLIYQDNKLIGMFIKTPKYIFTYMGGEYAVNRDNKSNQASDSERSEVLDIQFRSLAFFPLHTKGYDYDYDFVIGIPNQKGTFIKSESLDNQKLDYYKSTEGGREINNYINPETNKIYQYELLTDNKLQAKSKIFINEKIDFNSDIFNYKEFNGNEIKDINITSSVSDVYPLYTLDNAGDMQINVNSSHLLYPVELDLKFNPNLTKEYISSVTEVYEEYLELKAMGDQMLQINPYSFGIRYFGVKSPIEVSISKDEPNVFGDKKTEPESENVLKQYNESTIKIEVDGNIIDGRLLKYIITPHGDYTIPHFEVVIFKYKDFWYYFNQQGFVSHRKGEIPESFLNKEVLKLKKINSSDLIISSQQWQSIKGHYNY